MPRAQSSPQLLPFIGTIASAPYASSRSVTSTVTPISTTGRRGEYRFNFGKHRGKTLDQTPADYIQWCIENDLLRKRHDLKRALEEYRARRGLALVPALQSFEQRQEAIQEKVPAWLYSACNDAFERKIDYEGQVLSSASHLREMERRRLEAFEEMARSLAPLYPPRPAEDASLPESESVKALRAVLVLLPERAWNIEELHEGPGADSTNSVMIHWDGFTGIETIHLTVEREASIKRCLETIEKEHGKDVRGVANWEVRDKVRQHRD